MVRGAKFSWFKVDVLPVVAAVGVGVGFSIYHMARHLITSPDVHINKSYRMEGVPESGAMESRASGYNSGSIYRTMQGSRADKTTAEGRTRIF